MEPYYISNFIIKKFLEGLYSVLCFLSIQQAEIAIILQHRQGTGTSLQMFKDGF